MSQPTTWTPEERAEKLAQTRRIAAYGPDPEGPVMTKRQGESAAPSPADLFTEADLESFCYRSEPYAMPGGKRVWVHPVSIEEAAALNIRALQEVRRLNLPPEEAAVQHRLRAQVWQVIAACRKGPEPEAARVFGPEKAEYLRRNPGWLGAVQGICALSDSLSEGETEAQRLREALSGFFEQLQARLSTLSSHWSTASPGNTEASSEVLEGCVSFVSHWQRRVKSEG